MLTELQDEIREEEKAKAADPGEPEGKDKEVAEEERIEDKGFNVRYVFSEYSPLFWWSPMFATKDEVFSIPKLWY